MSNDKFPSIAHVSFSPGVHDDDIIVKGKSPIFKSTVVIHEKLDGGNCCIFQGQVYARSRNQVAKQPWFGQIKVLVNSFPQELYYQHFSELQLFGENMVAIHSIPYSNLKAPFYLFAVYDPKSDEWFSVKKVEAVARSLGLLSAPKLFEGSFSSEDEVHAWCLENMESGSALGGNREGFVFRVPGRFKTKDFESSICKYVRKGHVQTGKTRDFISNWKRADIDQEYIEPKPDFETLSFLVKKKSPTKSKKRKKKEKKEGKSKKKKVASRFIVTVGIQASGKSTFAEHLCQGNSLFSRAGRDLLGSNDAVYAEIANQLRKGSGVVVENCNVMPKQRRDAIQAANVFLSNREKPMCVVFNVPFEECLQRAHERKGHETGDLFINTKKGDKVMRSFYKSFRSNLPTTDEGFGEIVEVSSLDDVNRLLVRLGGKEIVLEDQSKNNVKLGCAQSEQMNLPILYQYLGVKDNQVLNVYVWGSRLWGTHNAESDYDFIVILKGHAGFKENKHFGGMVDVSLYDEKSWAEESEKKYAPAWTYYFPEEAKWKETRPPEKPDADGLKAAIGQRLKKGMKIMSKKIKTNNDLALRKFGHNLRMIELTRWMLLEGEMRQDLAIQKIEEYKYEPPSCWLNILEEEYARLLGKEVKEVKPAKKKKPKKDSKRSKKDSRKAKQSKKKETGKHCDESKLGCQQTERMNLQVVYELLDKSSADVLNVYISWGPRIFGTHTADSPYDFVIVTKGEDDFCDSISLDEVRFLIYDQSRWNLEFRQNYFLCYFSHFLPPSAKWKEELPVSSLGALSFGEMMKGIEARIGKDVKIMKKKILRRKSEQALEKFERCLRIIFLALTVAETDVFDPLKANSMMKHLLQLPDSQYETTIMTHLNNLRQVVSSRGSMSISDNSILIKQTPEPKVEEPVIQEEEVHARTFPVVIKSSEESVIREIFHREDLIDLSGCLKVGFDVGGVIINSASTVHHKTEDTTFLKEHLQTPEVYGAISTIVECAQTLGPRNVFLVSYCGPRRDAKTLEWLEHHEFFKKTGMPRNHLIFCRKRDHKGPICTCLGIQYFVDDSLQKVLEPMMFYKSIRKLLWLNLKGKDRSLSSKMKECKSWHRIKTLLWKEFQDFEAPL